MTIAFRETDIRPDHLLKGQAERFANDVARLLNHRADFVDVSCPACGSDRRLPAFTKYEMQYVDCADCQTMFISPRPRPDHLAEYYQKSENYEYWNRYIFPASEETRREKIFKPRAARVLEILERHAISAGVLLEVGAGFGTFCEEIRRIGRFSRIVAVEPTPDLAATCRGRGLEVIESPIERVAFEEASVDVIVSFEAIEHMFDPGAFVTQCRRLMKQGGALILTCPNVRGFDIVTMREHSVAVDPEHLNYFNPRSLAQLLERHGFQVLESQTPGQLDAELVRKKALAGEFDLAPQPFLQQVLIDEWERVGAAFQMFLAANGLSSHMWLAARKA